MSEEARKHPRIDSQNMSYICVDDAGTTVAQSIGKTLNVSESGICLEINFKAEINYTLLLTVAMEDSLVDIKGKIVNCRPREDGMYEIGVEFSDLDDANMEIYMKYLKLFNKENSLEL